MALVFLALLGYALTTQRAGSPAAAPAMPNALSAPATSAFVAQPRPAWTAEEEAFVTDLWKVHETVKTNAARMAFAGLYYKTGDITKEEVRRRVAPLAETYRAAAERVRQLRAPTTFAELQQRYLTALRLYEQASIEMVRVAEDGNSAHLVSAHEKSSQASTNLLKVGNELWPGEYKPN